VTSFVYRLDITKPDGADAPGWEPSEWCDICHEHDWLEHDWNDDWGSRRTPPFSWPRRRHYLSRAAAEGRADYLRRCGASVHITIGRVVWPEGEA
jgi:hypothetical protein